MIKNVKEHSGFNKVFLFNNFPFFVVIVIVLPHPTHLHGSLEDTTRPRVGLCRIVHVRRHYFVN